MWLLRKKLQIPNIYQIPLNKGSLHVSTFFFSFDGEVFSWNYGELKMVNSFNTCWSTSMHVRGGYIYSIHVIPLPLICGNTFLIVTNLPWGGGGPP